MAIPPAGKSRRDPAKAATMVLAEASAEMTVDPVVAELPYHKETWAVVVKAKDPKLKSEEVVDNLTD